MRESPWRIQDWDTARRLRRPAAAPRGSIDDYRIFFIDGVVCSS
jgi:hypothetical protein